MKASLLSGGFLGSYMAAPAAASPVADAKLNRKEHGSAMAKLNDGTKSPGIIGLSSDTVTDSVPSTVFGLTLNHLRLPLVVTARSK
jgi:hypothetical protein